MRVFGIGIDSALRARMDGSGHSLGYFEDANSAPLAEADIVIVSAADPAEPLSRLDGARRHGVPYVLFAGSGDALARALSLGADDALLPDGRDLEARLAVAEHRIAVRKTREPMATLAEHLDALDEAPMGYFEVEADGTILHCSDSLARLAGYESASDLCGRPVVELYADPGERHRLLGHLALRHSATSYPVRLRTRDGGVRHLMLSTVLHHDVVYGLAVDVSETHRVVEQLRRSEELTRRILEAMPGGVVHVRKDGAVLRANGEAQRILGLRLDELTQKYVLDFEPETLLGDGSPCSAEDYPVSRALATGEPQPRTLIGVRRPGGGVSWAVFTAVPVKDPDTGETSGAVVTFVDITEHRAAQEALAESEERYRRLVEHSPDPMAIVSQDRLLFVNAAGVDLMARGDLVGTSAMDLVPKERVPEVRAYVDAALEGKRVGTVQADLVRRDGGRVAVELSAAPLVYQGKRATLVVARDIRARRRAEDELSRLQEKFQHTQKLESLGILAGGIAHDFNNLLSAILGNASLAKLHLPDDSRSVRHVAAIEKAAQQAADLTGQMLAYSGRGRLRSEPVDVSAMVAEMIELLTSVVSKKAVVETRFDAPGALVLGDVSQLRQVAMNLLLNASDALDDHPGRIVIRTRLSQLERRQLAESYLDDGLAAGNYLTLEVSDTGRGMDANTVAKVFDPFFTTKSTGRGLGLAATLGIIRAHRGAVEVHSKVGEGTRFSVHLPTSDGLSQIVAEPAAETTVGDASVLVVDDEPMVREVTGAMLVELGYRCQLAASGSEAIRRLRADPADVDVVILDMTMPDMNGVEALAALRAVRPDLPVVLCSGYSEAEVSDRTGGSLANAFLQKPFTTSELIAKLQTALGR